MAVSVESEDDNGRVVRYVRHTNGGGLVSPQARVYEGAWRAECDKTNEGRTARVRGGKV